MATELRAMRDVFDEIRTQLHWLATNGIPRWEPAIEERRHPAPISVAVVREDTKLPGVDSPEADLIQQVIEHLETSVASIATDQLALFVDALDDARDELVAALKGDPQETLNFNELPDDGPVPPRPVLPTGNDNPKPQDTHDLEEPASSTVSDRSTEESVARSRQRSLFDAPELSKLPLFEPGDAVEFEKDGTDLFGEIVALDDANNQASVMLIPSEEHVAVSQDELTKTKPDPLAPHSQPDSTQPGQSG